MNDKSDNGKNKFRLTYKRLINITVAVILILTVSIPAISAYVKNRRISSDNEAAAMLEQSIVSYCSKREIYSGDILLSDILSGENLKHSLLKPKRKKYFFYYDPVSCRVVCSKEDMDGYIKLPYYLWGENENFKITVSLDELSPF